MKGLSIRQPWAWLIVNGYKLIENRDWRYVPSYRGELAIHASKKFDWDGYYWVLQNFPEIPLPGKEIEGKRGIPYKYDRGGFVGVATMHDVVKESENPWFFGPLGFKLHSPRSVDLIRFKGNLGLFNVPDEVAEKLAA